MRLTIDYFLFLDYFSFSGIFGDRFSSGCPSEPTVLRFVAVALMLNLLKVALMTKLTLPSASCR
jgi:hypothetical protein